MSRVRSCATVVTMGRGICRAGLAALATGCVLVAGGCTGEEPRLVGHLGLSVDRHGAPVLVLAGCRGAIDGVDLSLLPWASSKDSGRVGAWHTGRAVTGLVRLDLADPGPRWAPTAPTSLEPGKHYIAEATSSTAHLEALNDLTFASRQLRDLRPDTVYTDSEDADSTALVPHPADEFVGWACRHLGE